MPTHHDRILGCLMGGACGDALGAPVEFLAHDEILRRFGPDGIAAFAPAYGGIGRITDDTQMTLFTVEGLIRAVMRMDGRGICHPPSVVHRAYLRWLLTRDERYAQLDSLTLGNRPVDGWLVRDRRLWSPRAPGNTCLSALRATLRNGGLGDHANNDSKGCGTVMRDAPFGLGVFPSPAGAFEAAVETAWTTHGHPSARYASGALAAIVAYLVRGATLRDAVDHAMELLVPHDESREVRDALQQAVALSTLPDWRRRSVALGEGWVAEEALAIAVLCALAAGDAKEAIVAAVNRTGDSDSTGAITGNIVGARDGIHAIPAEWTSQVELRDVIETLARDLALIVGPGLSDDESDAFDERYPGW